MKPIGVPSADASSCNFGNHLEYAPYYYDADPNTILLEPEFYNFATPFTIHLIRQTASRQGLSVVDASDAQPKPRTWAGKVIGKDVVLASPAGLVYKAYLHQFNFDAYSAPLRPLLPHHRMHILSKREIARLAEWVTTYCCTERLAPRDAFEEETPRLWSFLEAALSNDIASQTGWSDGVFVRLGTTSGKNDQRPSPCRTSIDVMNRLCSNRLLLKEYNSNLDGEIDTPLTLILMPWNRCIRSDREWRVFVKDGRVTGIAQQQWYSRLGHTDASALAASDAIAQLVQEVVALAPFRSMVLDVWYDEDEAKAHLIECNPWGCWGASGSSLFRWIEDADVLEGQSDPEIRYRC